MFARVTNLPTWHAVVDIHIDEQFYLLIVEFSPLRGLGNTRISADSAQNPRNYDGP